MDRTPADDVFRSILWPGSVAAEGSVDGIAEPDCFRDLNLDQVVAAIDQAWPEENLGPFFHVPARDVETIGWRQDVLRDLDRAPLRQALAAAVERLRDMRKRLAGIAKLYYPVEKQRAHLGAAETYVATVQALADDLARLRPASPGLQHLRAWLAGYAASSVFNQLRHDVADTLAALDTIRYDLLIRPGSVTVRPYADEAEASGAVEATFAKFRPDGQAQEARTHGPVGFGGLNHIEAQVVAKLALLQPQPFAMLDTFCTGHAEFIDPVVARLAREACFYLAWLQYVEPLRGARLAFCYPTLSPEARSVDGAEIFDLALAAKLTAEHHPVVRNDFALVDGERVLVVTGPNHGGKTTFARTFGQLHWLAALGLTVPGSSAHLQLFDALLTHFERAERVETLRGKLKDDLFRMHAILARATPRSVIVMNEIFASTTLDDALALGRRVMARLARLGALTVCVTFLTELADFDAHTVSMVAAVDPHDPAVRTFRVARRPADGLAYALAVADKYRVTRAWLLRRIAP